MMGQYNSFLSGAPVLLALACLVVFAAALVLAPAPLLHDYAEWAFQAKILSLYWTQRSEVADYSLYPYPVPYLLTHYLMAGYNLFLAPILAAKAFILSYVALSCWVFSRFLQRYVSDIDQRHCSWALLVCLATFSSFFLVRIYWISARSTDFFVFSIDL